MHCPRLKKASAKTAQVSRISIGGFEPAMAYIMPTFREIHPPSLNGADPAEDGPLHLTLAWHFWQPVD
jgi:hypothetical protein